MPGNKDHDQEILGTLALAGATAIENVALPWDSPHTTTMKRVMTLQSSDDRKTTVYIIGLASRELFRKARTWADLNPPSRLYCVPNAQLKDLLALKENCHLVEEFLLTKNEWHEPSTTEHSHMLKLSSLSTSQP